MFEGGVRKLRNYKGGVRKLLQSITWGEGGVKNEAKSHYVICEWPLKNMTYIGSTFNE